MPYTADGTPYAPGSASSEDAAHAQKRKKSSDALAIEQYVRECGRAGSTCDEASAVLRMQYATATGRVNELVKRGILVRTTTRRRTRSGATASVLVHAAHVVRA